jgi:arylsulfatase A-like enzyme
VAAAEAIESRHAIGALSLLGVLAAAKTITLVAARVPLSIWAPLAYYWQDVLVALAAFAAFALAGRTLGRLLYVTVAAYVALNVPVTLVLSTPMTRPMLRATGSALADSIVRYATPINIAIVVALMGLSAVLPRLLAGRLRIGAPTLATATLVVLLGPFATARLDTRGLHRNALGAMLETSVARVPAVQAAADWRSSRFGSADAAEDLSRLRGAAAGRNVITVVLESTAARYLGLYGAARDPMPALTALARRGVIFDRMYAVYPESVKELLATLCSQSPAFDTPVEAYAGLHCSSIAERLRTAGYRTGLFHSGRFDYLGMRAMIDHRGFDTLEDAGAIGGHVHSSFGVDEAAAVARMLAWIDARDGRPFFITYLPIAGHHPYVSNVPGPFDAGGSDDFPRYLNALHESDQALAALLAGLRARGLEEKTLLLVVGDHGEAFGQHPGNFAHTLFINEENVHVPFVVALPGVDLGGTRVGRVASLLDLAPTLLDLVGRPAPVDYQGRSLLPPGARMALFFTDYSLGWLGLADGCWKYLHEVDANRSHLYDVCSDPRETVDRAREEPDRVDWYRERVRRWAAAQRAAVAGGSEKQGVRAQSSSTKPRSFP